MTPVLGAVSLARDHGYFRLSTSSRRPCPYPGIQIAEATGIPPHDHDLAELPPDTAEPDLASRARARANAPLMLDRAKPAPRRTVLRQAALHANLRRPTQPAFAVYRTDPHAPIAHATGLIVLTLEGAQIAAITNFLGSSALPQFGLPRTLPL